MYTKPTKASEDTDKAVSPTTPKGKAVHSKGLDAFQFGSVVSLYYLCSVQISNQLNDYE
jgi:hypothetical protein